MLIYSPIASLDGHVEDEQGKFDWAAPDDEVHAFVNKLERPIGTYLYGRRMYETMVFWETVSGGADQPTVICDFAEIWRAARKSCSRGRSRRWPSSGRTSSAPSTPKRFVALKEAAEPTSRSEVQSLPGRRSPPSWSTSYTCSSGRSLLVAASAHCPTASRPLALMDEHRFETASFTSTTALAADRERQHSGKQPYLLRGSAGIWTTLRGGTFAPIRGLALTRDWGGDISLVRRHSFRGIAQASFGGVPDGPAPRKQSRARRRPAAIGVTEMSPNQKPAQGLRR